MDETLNAPVDVTEAETINSNETVIMEETEPVEITDEVTEVLAETVESDILE